MPKAIIVIFILILCCCITCAGFTFLFGSFEFNDRCAYKGPLAQNMGNACDTFSQIEIDEDFTQYTGLNSDDFTFAYPKTFTVREDESRGITFLYAQNNQDNMNILLEDTEISVNRSNCASYAEDTIESLSEYSAILKSSSTTTIGGYDACLVEFNADYGGGNVEQTQYYVSIGTHTYILTITINLDEDNFESLNAAARSFEVN